MTDLIFERKNIQNIIVQIKKFRKVGLPMSNAVIKDLSSTQNIGLKILH